ncbi:MAG: hypothetical protein KUG77_18845, partial [Nannocystaceae bacterium]|nr:hypothetical protein [Nannocystaceae bacterium]
MSILHKKQRPTPNDIAQAMQRLVHPGRGHLMSTQAFAAAIGLQGSTLTELRSLPLGALGQRLMALRYVIENADVWIQHFGWEAQIVALDELAPARVRRLMDQVARAREGLPEQSVVEADLAQLSLVEVAEAAATLEQGT